MSKYSKTVVDEDRYVNIVTRILFVFFYKKHWYHEDIINIKSSLSSYSKHQDEDQIHDDPSLYSCIFSDEILERIIKSNTRTNIKSYSIITNIINIMFSIGKFYELVGLKEKKNNEDNFDNDIENFDNDIDKEIALSLINKDKIDFTDSYNINKISKNMFENIDKNLLHYRYHICVIKGNDEKTEFKRIGECYLSNTSDLIVSLCKLYIARGKARIISKLKMRSFGDDFETNMKKTKTYGKHILNFSFLEKVFSCQPRLCKIIFKNNTENYSYDLDDILDKCSEFVFKKQE
jgi:hypothetical protein